MMYGQYYGIENLVPASGHMTMGGYQVTSWKPGNATTNMQPQQTIPKTAPSGMFADPFGTAMSGNKSGTLQPYVNRMTQNASNALYGGLLGYSPQSIVAGDAGGTPVNSTVPQFNIPSALSQYGNGLNFTGFGKRSWMGGGNGN